MRILINDIPDTHEHYRRIFRSVGYEANELIFRSSFEETRAFLAQELERRKRHIDLIITGRDREGGSGLLQAQGLQFLKNQLVTSYSKGNLRIAAIPLILYTASESKELLLFGFDAIVEKNKEGDHRYFIHKCESVIRGWRQRLLEDLDKLQIKLRQLAHFPHSKVAKEYLKRVTPRADHYFSHITKVMSLEFIKSPEMLWYDWLQVTTEGIEEPYDQFNQTLKWHLKYGGKVTERTVWHALFRQHHRLLLRDVYTESLYERNLREAQGQESQECDFILTTEFPDQTNTTFLEVKREDKQYYVNKNRKRPRFSSKFLDDLEQVWQYYKYTLNLQYEPELTEKVGYATSKFDFVLLAGRREEKEEMQGRFETDLHDHYREIQVQSFEDFADMYVNYMEKFGRLQV